MKTLSISEKANLEAKETKLVKTFTEKESPNIYVDAVKFLNSNYELAMDINEDMLEMNFEVLQLSEELPIPLEDQPEKHVVIRVSEAA